METYKVDMNTCGPMVLDALIKIKVTVLYVYYKTVRYQICAFFREFLFFQHAENHTFNPP